MRNQSIRAVTVKLQKIGIASFSPTDRMLSLHITLHDGRQKHVTRSTPLKEPGLLALQLIEELVIMEKNQNLDFDGESLTGEVDVMIENRQMTEALLLDFFQTLYSKAQRIKNAASAEGYMDLLRDFQRTSFES
jgi:hypothetical protein